MIDKFAHGFINSVYDFNDFTLNELICKLAQKMDEVITQSNESFNYLDWLKNEGVSDEVQAIMNSMLEDGTLENLINIEKYDKLKNDLLEEFNNKINRVAFIMPEPSDAARNTQILQTYLNIAKENNVQVTVLFKNGDYKLNTCIIYSNTNIILSNKTNLIHIMNSYYNPDTGSNKDIPILFLNSKPFDANDSNITSYNGRSNIRFIGGNLDCQSGFLFNHGKNILIEKVKFKNIKSDHAIQIGGCKNVIIKDCEFEGMLNTSDNRQYVEMIQIDWLTSSAEPYWVSGSNIFDGTINDGIIIENCRFKKGNDNYGYLKTCIGSHSSDGVNKNKNITIKNCEFNDFEYGGVVIDKMINVTLYNNNFYTSSSQTPIQITNSKNVYIDQTNKINGGGRGIYCIDSNNIYIDGIEINNIVGTSDYVLFGECNNVNLNNIVIKNSIGGNYNVLIRNCSNFSSNNCKDIDTTTSFNYYFRVYNKNNLINENIFINNVISNKHDISIAPNSVNKIICSDNETIWRGNISTGQIILDDDIDKFTNLKIYYDFYGNCCNDLIFDNNQCNIRNINLPDNLSTSTTIVVMDLKLRLIDNKTISISVNNKVTIENGNVNVDNNSIINIYKIRGKRITF